METVENSNANAGNKAIQISGWHCFKFVNHTRNEIKEGLVNFDNADHDPDPNCLLNKNWELIKLDFEELEEE